LKLEAAENVRKYFDSPPALDPTCRRFEGAREHLKQETPAAGCWRRDPRQAAPENIRSIGAVISDGGQPQGMVYFLEAVDFKEYFVLHNTNIIK